ncbi:hypothetical protein KIN20_012551 [Parelaphostrongylus tenuis]|uniref:Uncharacterized protein n=1 Tax=Parelaphostrongylus tenuis TaxID=148309 RepID=A0AAD5QLX1_PARTN|nr:hypothetical protein KIN20_012551 [Parelaphostrongylus tenuis]
MANLLCLKEVGSDGTALPQSYTMANLVCLRDGQWLACHSAEVHGYHPGFASETLID